MSMFVILLAITLWLLYRFWVSAYSYWKDRGFPFVPGHFPFGSSKELCTETKYQGFIMQEFCSKMRSHPIFGIYVMRTPVLVAQDPEIIRLVMANNFSHFRDRTPIQRSPKEFMGHHLFNLDGDRWRPLRVKLSPTFTSGKIKSMLPLLLKCSEIYDKMLLTRLETSVDIKDLTSSFTLDTICSCAFGLEVNSLMDENSEVKQIANTIFKKNYITMVKRSLLQSFPTVARKIPVRILSEKTANYLLDLITKTVEFRKERGVVRNDFLDIMLELKEKEASVKVDEKDISSSNIEMTHKFMTAQCFVFLAAGFETSSSIQSFFLYEMALNPNMQERVHNEIVKAINDHGGLTYQSIQDMKYLDMAIHETLRKYPTVPILTRCCTKTFDLPNGQTIEKGTVVWVPVYTLHQDPLNYPKPEVFDPERFSEENKSNIKPFTYLPFGEGPRICIGVRFGILQTKIGLISLLRKYRVERTSNTPDPIKFVGSFLVTTTDGPLELKITKRNDS